MTTEQPHLCKLRAALICRADLARRIERQTETTRGLQQRDAELAKNEQDLVEAESNEAARRLLDGAESAPPNAKRRKEIVAIRTEREPLPAAIVLSSEREAELRKKAAEIEQQIAHNAFAYASTERAKAAQAIKGALDALAPHLVTLAATDAVQRGITSEQPVFSADEFPDEFSGAFVAEKLLKGLTFFIRPEPLTEVQFAKAVAETTAEHVSKLTEGTDA
jgi:hypothetical protein